MRKRKTKENAMPVIFDSEKKIFKLDTKGSSYVFAVNQDGILVHTYYGAPVEECDLSYLNERFSTPGICPKPHYAPGGTFTLDTAPIEFPCTGTGEYRPAALSIRAADGTTATLALLNDAVKKGGVMASSHVGGLSGAFIPVSEDAGMIAAAKSGHLDITKLEAMTAVCSVGLDMIVVPGDITPEGKTSARQQPNQEPEVDAPKA